MRAGGRRRSWTDEQLISIVQESRSIRMVIQKLGLIPAGGNYVQVTYYIKNLGIDTSHFKGMGWNRGESFPSTIKIPLEKILVENSTYQSFKLRNRLIIEGIKKPQCELCGWNQRAKDGRMPLELDHINGIHNDNRLENLRILCPNCHSLQPTHRGRNKNKNHHS